MKRLIRTLIASVFASISFFAYNNLAASSSVIKYNEASFHGFKYDHACILSISRKVIDTASDEVQNRVLLPFSKTTGGKSFINSKGKPIHKFYSKRLLTSKQIESLHNCFKSTVAENETMMPCIPIYRDAIIYYDKNNIPVGWISICFECQIIYFIPQNNGISNGSIGCVRSLFNSLGLIEN